MHPVSSFLAAAQELRQHMASLHDLRPRDLEVSRAEWQDVCRILDTLDSVLYWAADSVEGAVPYHVLTETRR